jgi:hypothetical protein
VADGGDGDDQVSATGEGSVGHGGPGNDWLLEGNPLPTGVPAAAKLLGEDGSDRLTLFAHGATADGGAGDDTFENGLANVSATFTALPGNTILGGPGADSVDALNGVTDAIDCGEGGDTVRHDGADAVSACETDLTPVKGPPPIVKPPAPAALAFHGARSLRATATSTIRVIVACPARATCAGRLRLRRGTVTLADAKLSVTGTRTVALKLTRSAAKLLKRRGRLAATLSFIPSAKGTPAPKPRTLTLLAPRHR